MMQLWLYLYGVVIALDRVANAILLGHPNETLSHRAATAWANDRVWGCYFCRLLEFLDRDHCRGIISFYAGDPITDLLLPAHGPNWKDFGFLEPLVPYLPLIFSHYW